MDLSPFLRACFIIVEHVTRSALRERSGAVDSGAVDQGSKRKVRKWESGKVGKWESEGGRDREAARRRGTWSGDPVKKRHGRTRRDNRMDRMLGGQACWIRFNN